MGKWLGYMVELYHDGQWYNIDQWHRHANGQLRHHFLYTAPERDILSSAHDELALSRERICFSDLAAETRISSVQKIQLSNAVHSTRGISSFGAASLI